MKKYQVSYTTYENEVRKQVALITKGAIIMTPELKKHCRMCFDNYENAESAAGAVIAKHDTIQYLKVNHV